MDKLETLASHVKTESGSAILSSRIDHGELTLNVARDRIVEVLTFLRDDPQCRFEVLIDICGVDWPSREKPERVALWVCQSSYP